MPSATNVQQMPGTSRVDDLSISQAQMREYFKLEQAFMDAKARYLAVQARMILRLNARVGQEPGKYRLVKKGRVVRRVSWKEEYVKIRGPKAAEAVLARAEGKRHWKLAFEAVVNG